MSDASAGHSPIHGPANRPGPGGAGPGFPFVTCTPDLQVHWARGCNLHTGQRAWVPASLVFTSYFYTQNPTRGEPLTNMPFNAGGASGPTRERAVTAALEEIIERDAVYLRWVSGAELVEVAPPGWLAALAQGPLGVLHTRFYHFPNAFDMPVIGALMEDTSSWEATGYGRPPRTSAPSIHAYCHFPSREI